MEVPGEGVGEWMNALEDHVLKPRAPGVDLLGGVEEGVGLLLMNDIFHKGKKVCGADLGMASHLEVEDHIFSNHLSTLLEPRNEKSG